MKYFCLLKRAMVSVALFYLLAARCALAFDPDDPAFRYSAPDETVIGEVRRILYTGVKTPLEIGRAYNLGYREMEAANPGLSPNRTVRGSNVNLPTAWILPEVMDEGILINLAEMRLYFFQQTADRGGLVNTFPIGIGRDGYKTPTGDFHVTGMAEDPTWFPSRSSREISPDLPTEVPPGPSNPLGKHWIQLSIKGYGIHGTNRPGSIGRRASLGCIRLFPENVAWLFDRVHPGMAVRIVDRPVKLGRRNGQLYIEVHGRGRGEAELLNAARRAAGDMKLDGFDDEWIRPYFDGTKDATVPVPLAAEAPVVSAAVSRAVRDGGTTAIP